MGEVLLVVFAIIVTWIILLVIAFALVARHLDRRNRVSRSAPSTAPISWLVSPARPAVMHRRLRNAVQVSRLTVPLPATTDPELSVPQLRRQLEEQAVVIDHHLVVVSRYPRTHRKPVLRQIDQDVRNLEALSRRLGSLDQRPTHLPATGWTSHEHPTAALGRITEQLQLLEDARQEIDFVERTGGGIDAEAIIAQGSTPPPIGPGQPAPIPHRSTSEPVRRPR